MHDPESPLPELLSTVEEVQRGPGCCPWDCRGCPPAGLPCTQLTSQPLPNELRICMTARPVDRPPGGTRNPLYRLVKWFSHLATFLHPIWRLPQPASGPLRLRSLGPAIRRKRGVRISAGHWEAKVSRVWRSLGNRGSGLGTE